MEAELEEARRQLREAQRRHEADTEALTRRHDEATQASARDHEQVTEAHAALQDELRQQTEALESTREALAAERAESGRLRNRFAQLQEAGPGTGSAATAPSPRPTRAACRAGQRRARAASHDRPRNPRLRRRAPHRRPSQRDTSRRESSRRQRSRRDTRQREPDPTETQRFDVLGLQDELEQAPSPPPSRSASRRAGQQTPDPPAWNPPTADRLRPLNPSLRHRTNWFGRLLASARPLRRDRGGVGWCCTRRSCTEAGR